ncbi:hypothetical protein U1Q18_035344 [Sarracenia purpurea var. burkii]
MMSSRSFKSSNIDAIGTEFCADDLISGEMCGEVDSDPYHYPLGDISQTDNDLSFLDNDCEDKECNDLLYNGWPDIGNFEDVFSMFRTCDSTFGLGGIGNEDELSWFPSSHPTEGSEDVLKSGVKFSSHESNPFKNIPEHHEPSKLNKASSSVDDSNMDSASINYKPNLRVSEGGDPEALCHLAFMHDSDAISECKYEFTPKEQKKQAKHPNQRGGKRKDRCLDNVGSLRHTGNLRFKDTKLSYGDSSRQISISPDVKEQKKNIGPNSFGYLQTSAPNMHLDYTYPSNQVHFSGTRLCIKSESTDLTSLSPKKLSSASNRLQSIESCYDRSIEAPAVTVDHKREMLQGRQEFNSSCRSNPKHVVMVVQTASCDPVSVPKQGHHSQNEFENHSEVEAVSTRIPADLDSSNVQESSCMSSGLDDISLEASSFRQLQKVVEQLDIRTRLCIRDSLYRLARSAEQRHHHASLNSGCIDDRNTSGAFIAEGTNKCSGFMDIETNTNPIDRSIAHLLFHRPSGSSVTPAHDGFSHKSHTTIHRPVAGPSVMSEKLVCQEGTASEADKEVADDD